MFNNQSWAVLIRYYFLSIKNKNIRLKILKKNLLTLKIPLFISNIGSTCNKKMCRFFYHETLNIFLSSSNMN